MRASVGTVARVDVSLPQLDEAGAEFLPGLLGIRFGEYSEPGVVHAQLTLRQAHFAPHGYVHAATVVALADTAAGYGCLLTLPEGATGFTTIELKSNFLRTAREGAISCEARLQHGGRTTQLWDATVSDPEGRTMALFRCTQLVLR
jgi:1,4-dihydroxy-2-naphthoyl-CoA hydrolase